MTKIALVIPATESEVLIEGNPRGNGGHTIEFTDGTELSVGRSGGRRLMFNTDKLSRDHGKYRVIDGVLNVMDHGSLNGTLVNGAKIATLHQWVPLKHGDTVEMGSVVATVQIGDAPAVPADTGPKTQVLGDRPTTVDVPANQ